MNITNANKKAINTMIKKLETLEDDHFAKVWNTYCSNSIGIAEAKREKQYIKKREDLNYKKGYDYSDAMYSLAQDICIYFHKTYESRTYEGGPLLDSSYKEIASLYKDISADEFLEILAAKI